ncbi:PHP domain-containing protein [Geoalkalibacter subterraneus]|jgi:predicted metal-dependent phosphoesterase TrpH|uniref:PHP domain-containing protein n=1 Tax=Geoalkalibacter subterraneus TaxID=483547 RepID=UPI0006948EBC|nr:PHP domain-containing protein [Geoalkalibacter subterraneus]
MKIQEFSAPGTKPQGPLADLHVHTTYSDGLFSPEEVVAKARHNGVHALAICDHDNIDGIEPAIGAARGSDLEIVAGVELSSQWQDLRDIHILGYGFDPHAPELFGELADFRDFRARRNEMIVQRVNEVLAAEGRTLLDFRQIRRSAGGTVGRPHIARALIEAGHVRDNDEAFNRYLVRCNVEKRFFPADQAISLIHRAGGVAVLAHPPLITDDSRVLLHLLDAFVGLGLDGIEAYNNAGSLDEVAELTALGRQRKLIVTGGSDFHGFPDSAARIGWARGEIPIPLSCWLEVRDSLAQRAAG